MILGIGALIQISCPYLCCSIEAYKAHAKVYGKPHKMTLQNTGICLTLEKIKTMQQIKWHFTGYIQFVKLWLREKSEH